MKISNFLVGNRPSRKENRSILPNIAKLVRKNSAKLDIEMSTRSKNFVEFTVGTFIVLVIVKIHISKISRKNAIFTCITKKSAQ